MGRVLQRHVLEKLPGPLVGSHAVTAGDFVFIGGLLPTDYRTGLVDGARPRSALALVDDTLQSQSEYLVRTAETILAHCGATFDSIVRIDQFITDRTAAAPYLRARREQLSMPRRPASTMLEIPGLPVPAAKISADIIAAAAGVSKKGIFTDKAPVNFPGAPHGAQAGPFIFVQGQLATDFVAAVVPEAAPTPFPYETTIERETEYVIKTLGTILENSDSSLEDVVKANVYLTNLSDFAEFERVWGRYFSSAPPARTVIPVSGLVSPNCHVEINVVAVRHGEPREYFGCGDTSSRAPLIESEAVRAGDFLFFSGLIAGDFRRGLAPEAMVPPDAPYFYSAIERQVLFSLNTAKRICADAGTSLDQLCRSQIFLRGMRDYYDFTRAWNAILADKQPVVTTVQTPDAGLCPDARVVLDLTAYVPKEGVS
jgi:enamine deaminase RidA (YjgF/YER057c/UK114 family)